MEITLNRYKSVEGKNVVSVKIVAGYEIHHTTLSLQLARWARDTVKSGRNSDFSLEETSKLIARTVTECKATRSGNSYTTVGTFDC